MPTGIITREDAITAVEILGGTVKHFIGGNVVITNLDDNAVQLYDEYLKAIVEKQPEVQVEELFLPGQILLHPHKLGKQITDEIWTNPQEAENVEVEIIVIKRRKEHKNAGTD